jgi:hypothetical protein
MRLIRRPRCFLPSEALSHRHKLPKSSGVYYVMKGWEVLYVGLSKNVHTRWNSTSNPHHKLNIFYGDRLIRIHYQVLPLWMIGNYEAAEIDRYKPPHNHKRELIVPSVRWSIYAATCWVADSFLIALGGFPLLFIFGVFQ